MTDDLDEIKLKESEYREASFDWRHRDAMLWQTLAVAIVFSGVVFSSWGDPKYSWLLKIIITGVAIPTNVILLTKIVKDNYYQFGSSELLRRLGQENLIAALYPHRNEKLVQNTRIWKPDEDYLLQYGKDRIPNLPLYRWLNSQSTFKLYFYFLCLLIAISAILCVFSIVCYFNECHNLCRFINNAVACTPS